LLWLPIPHPPPTRPVVDGAPGLGARLGTHLGVGIAGIANTFEPERVVIGGGLTGIDTATELFAYYPVQVEKMLTKYEKIVEEFGEQKVWEKFDEEEKGVLTEFLEHGRAVRDVGGLAVRRDHHHACFWRVHPG
jgi:predicted NBD/HSP70 family sugar kinase